MRARDARESRGGVRDVQVCAHVGAEAAPMREGLLLWPVARVRGCVPLGPGWWEAVTPWIALCLTA